MNRPFLLPLLLLAVPFVACEEKDPIDEAMEEIALEVDTTAISIGDEDPTPEPELAQSGSGAAASGAAPRSGSSASPQPVYLSGETITETDVVEVVHRRKGQVRACYEKELKSDPELAGTVAVAWTVTASGGVSRVRILANGTGNRDIESCIVRTIGSWSFPTGEVGVDIEYPFRFSPGV